MDFRELREDWFPGAVRSEAVRSLVAVGQRKTHEEYAGPSCLTVYFDPQGRLLEATLSTHKRPLSSLSLSYEGQSLHVSLSNGISQWYRDGVSTVATPYDGDSPPGQRQATFDEVLELGRSALCQLQPQRIEFLTESEGIEPPANLAAKWLKHGWADPGQEGPVATFSPEGHLVTFGTQRGGRYTGWWLVLDLESEAGQVFHAEGYQDRPFERVQGSSRFTDGVTTPDYVSFETWLSGWIGQVYAEAGWPRSRPAHREDH
ncbi:MAG: hypothetical protein AMXMBFR33_67930 [Candidatus Xenobia bacterium]